MPRFSSGFRFSSRLLGPIVIAVFFTSGLAGAATISATATPFTGDALSVTLTIDDAIDPGKLVITLEIDADGGTADLRGFFAQISDESLISGLSVSGPEITSSAFGANSVINLGGGNNLNGGGSPCPCDFGVEIGNPGIGGGDDFQSVTFVLSHVTEDLTIAFFANSAFGVRATSVGDAYDRSGSSKLGGVVPEPSAAILMLLGLAGLASGQRPLAKRQHLQADASSTSNTANAAQGRHLARA